MTGPDVLVLCVWELVGGRQINVNRVSMANVVGKCAKFRGSIKIIRMMEYSTAMSSIIIVCFILHSNYIFHDCINSHYL